MLWLYYDWNKRHKLIKGFLKNDCPKKPYYDPVTLDDSWLGNGFSRHLYLSFRFYFELQYYFFACVLPNMIKTDNNNNNDDDDDDDTKTLISPRRPADWPSTPSMIIVCPGSVQLAAQLYITIQLSLKLIMNRSNFKPGQVHFINR